MTDTSKNQELVSSENTNIRVQAPQSDSESGLVSMIERVAQNPDADIDKLERLLDMQERVMDKQAEQQWHQAMSQCQAAMPTIVAKALNNQTHSHYAKLEHIVKQITPVYTSNGFGISFDTAPSEMPDHVKILAYVSHIGGHTRLYSYDSPISTTGLAGKKNMTDTHGKASAVSYGRRYLTCLIFNLVIEGEDDDGNNGDNRTAAEVNGWWIAQIEALKPLLPSIVALKEALACEEWATAVEVWQELSDKEKGVIWSPAPTNGGILTTLERTLLKCDEFNAARKIYCQENKETEDE